MKNIRLFIFLILICCQQISASDFSEGEKKEQTEQQDFISELQVELQMEKRLDLYYKILGRNIDLPEHAKSKLLKRIEEIEALGIICFEKDIFLRKPCFYMNVLGKQKKISRISKRIYESEVSFEVTFIDCDKLYCQFHGPKLGFSCQFVPLKFGDEALMSLTKHGVALDNADGHFDIIRKIYDKNIKRVKTFKSNGFVIEEIDFING